MYRIRIFLLVITLLPVLAGLGFWQLERYREKLAIEQKYQQRMLESRTFSQLPDQEDLRYFRLNLTGRFHNESSFLLDNRIWQGQAGFHVITPFELSGGEIILVDRGWIPGTRDRRSLPDIKPVIGTVNLGGITWLPAGKAFLLAEDKWQQQWPKVIQAVDIGRMQAVLGRTVQPWFYILDDNQPGSFQRNFQVVNMLPFRHLGYAYQWFTMALVLVLLGGYAIYRAGRKPVSANHSGTEEQQL